MNLLPSAFLSIGMPFLAPLHAILWVTQSPDLDRQLIAGIIIAVLAALAFVTSIIVR